jgi:hypothetical protein
MSHISANDYEEFHESLESICAPEHIPECQLCHADNATKTVECEGREIQVCGYCHWAITGFNEGRI